MLDHLGDMVSHILKEHPWFRRCLFIAILAALAFYGSVSWNGLALWSAIFFGFEIMGYLFPPRRSKE